MPDYGRCKVSSAPAANARRFTVGLYSEALRAFSGRFAGLCCLALRFSAGRSPLSSDFATVICQIPLLPQPKRTPNDKRECRINSGEQVANGAQRYKPPERSRRMANCA
jgi:hypothetical protein